MVGTVREPSRVYAALLSLGADHCSIRTMHRILDRVEGASRRPTVSRISPGTFSIPSWHWRATATNSPVPVGDEAVAQRLRFGGHVGASWRHSWRGALLLMGAELAILHLVEHVEHLKRSVVVGDHQDCSAAFVRDLSE